MKDNPALSIPFAFQDINNYEVTLAELSILSAKTFVRASCHAVATHPFCTQWNRRDALYMDYFYYRGTSCFMSSTRHPQLVNYAIKTTAERKCVACLALRTFSAGDSVEDGMSDAELEIKSTPAPSSVTSVKHKSSKRQKVCPNRSDYVTGSQVHAVVERIVAADKQRIITSKQRQVIHEMEKDYAAVVQALPSSFDLMNPLSSAIIPNP